MEHIENEISPKITPLKTHLNNFHILINALLIRLCINRVNLINATRIQLFKLNFNGIVWASFSHLLNTLTRDYNVIILTTYESIIDCHWTIVRAEVVVGCTLWLSLSFIDVEVSITDTSKKAQLTAIWVENFNELSISNV